MDGLTPEQVIKYAKATDLRNFAVVNDYSDLIQIINLVLIELHSRLTIKQNVMEIPLDREKMIYNLKEYIQEDRYMTEVEIEKVVNDVIAVIQPKIDDLNAKYTALDERIKVLETPVVEPEPEQPVEGA